MIRLVKFFVALAVAVGATISCELCLSLRASHHLQEQVLADAEQRLEQIPSAIGDWQLQSQQALSREVIDMLQCRGHVLRSYLNQRTGRSIQLVVLIGPAGPLIVHRPEVCMDGQGDRIISGPERVEISQQGVGPHGLFRSTFSTKQSTGRRIVVYYGWSRGDRFEAPESPRLALGREPALCKIQVATNAESLSRTNQDQDAAQQFLKDFLPALNMLREKPDVVHSDTATDSPQ
jgi:hypothetical protein